MAPMKRARRDDDDVIAVDSASSNLRQDIRKKARISVNQSTSKPHNRHQPPPSSDSESEDEAVPDRTSQSPSLPPATQYEQIRDRNWEHLANEKYDDEVATQKLLARQETLGDNRPAENAIVEEIIVENFMCHKKLSIVIGPLINFVVGMNGSGKSACLTALTLCLGGKASATNRGTSLKSLIKEGCEQAWLTVKLKNQGVDAYQPDLYGPTIIVERQFSKSGSSGFKLKSSTGRVISNKKGDVDDLLEYYQLQVDNPMNVLTQDAAKSFIQTSTPAQKYKFFVEGVQLKQLDNDYNMLHSICDQIASKLDDSRGSIKYKEKIFKAAEARWNMVQQHEGMKRQSRILANQMAWAQVEDVEVVLAEKKHILDKSEEQLNQAREDETARDAAYMKVHAEMERQQQAIGELQKELEPLTEEQEAAKLASDEAANAVKKSHAEMRRIRGVMDLEKAKAKEYQDSIDAELRRMEEANGDAPARKQAEIETAKQEAVAAKEALNEHEAAGPGLDDSRRNAEEKVKKVGGPLSAKTQDVESCRNELHRLANDRGNSMAGYHRQMPRVLQAINNEKGFLEKPIGPLGQHIKVLKPKWSPIIEKSLNAALNAFIVTSKSDHQRLDRIFKQCNLDWSPIYIANNRQPINTANHEPDPQFDTVLHVLEIDNELVRSQLIINYGIEQVILIEKPADADRAMFSGPRLRNVKLCFSLHDARRDFGQVFRFLGGAKENSGVEFLKRPPRMSTNIESQIAHRKEMLAQLEQEKRDLEVQRQKYQQDVTRCKQAINRYATELKKLKVDLQRADERVERLETEFDLFNVEDGQIDALKQLLANVERDAAMYADIIGAEGLNKEELNQESLAKKRDLDAVKAKVDEHHMRMKKEENRFKKIQQARQIAVTEKNAAIERIITLQRQITHAEETVQAAEEKVEEYIGEASKVSERVPIGNNDTYDSLAAKYGKLKEQLSAARRRQGGSDEEVAAALEAAKLDYEGHKEHFEAMEDLLQLLKQTFAKRMEMYRRFQKHISARSRINFNYLLLERGFRGSLKIDHKHQLLDVHVEPDETVKRGKGRQTKTLSGGEKSFSSICLLLALWEAMGSPLRCLDEYDVFMDDVNRDVSSRLLIDAARRSVGRQFIFITPKALGAGVNTKKLGADVTIFKLPDPRDRGQQTIEDAMDQD